MTVTGWAPIGPQDYATFPPPSGWEGEGEGLAAAGQPPAVTDSKPDSLKRLLQVDHLRLLTAIPPSPQEDIVIMGGWWSMIKNYNR